MPELPFSAQAGQPWGWDVGMAASQGHPTKCPGVPAHREGARCKVRLETSSPKAQQDGDAGPRTPSWWGLSWLCVRGTARCVCPSVSPGFHQDGKGGARVLSSAWGEVRDGDGG